MTTQVNEFRALNAKWLNLHEAAFYCGFSIPYFNKAVRPRVTEIGSRPVTFDREELDRALDSLKLGNLPSMRGSTTSTATAAKGGSKRGMTTP